MAHSNKTLITIDNIDWTSKDATAKAFSHFRHLKLGYKLTLIAVIDEVSQCLDLYRDQVSTEALVYCNKVLDKYETAYQEHLQCIQNILHVHQVREFNKFINMEEEVHQKDRKVIEENLAKWKPVGSGQLRQLILRISNALEDQKLATIANNTAFGDDFDDSKPIGGARKKQTTFKDQPSFHPKEEIHQNSPSVKFADWEADMKSAYDISNCRTLPVPAQQQYVRRFVSSAFWSLLKHKISDDTQIFPPKEEHLRTGATVMEMLREINESINPKLIDRSKFFDHVQSEKDSNHKYLAQMKQLFVHHEIDQMTPQDILAYLTIKGFRSPETKKEIAKNVKGDHGAISMKTIEDTINQQAQINTYSKFGANSNSVNRITHQRQNQQQNQQQPKNQQNQQQPRNQQNQGQENNTSLPYVDFSTLTGWNKINQMKKRGYCTRCLKKHDEGKCQIKDNYQCPSCNRPHTIKACAGFKKLEPKQKKD